MKIALYVPSWPAGTTPNGIVTYAAHIVPALRRLGHVVYLLTFDVRTKTPDEFTIDLARFLPRDSLTNRIKRKFLKASPYSAAALAIVGALRELLQSKGIEVFEIEESFGWSYAVSSLHLLPVVVRLHGPWFLNGGFEGTRHPQAESDRERLEHRGIRNADLITSPSGIVLETVRSRYGLKLENSVVIPNPIGSAAQNERWHSNKCLPSTLLYVGRFDRRKGGDLILGAFSRLAEQDPRVRLTFVGPDLGVTAPDGTLECYDEYSRRNLSEFARERIDFRGTLSPLEIAPLRKAAFATIVASQYEILPYAVLEAMSYGCPLVATSVGGVPDLIQNLKNGLLVPTQDIDAMVAACRTLLDRSDLAAGLGERAWQDCNRDYGPDQLARRTVAAYGLARDRFKRST